MEFPVVHGVAIHQPPLKGVPPWGSANFDRLLRSMPKLTLRDKRLSTNEKEQYYRSHFPQDHPAEELMRDICFKFHIWIEREGRQNRR